MPGPTPSGRPLAPRRPRLPLTTRGWGLVTAIALTALAGRLFGIEEFFALDAGAGAVLVVAVVTSRLRRLEVAAGRRLQPGRVEAGATATVTLTVTNRSRRTSPPLELLDPLTGGRAARLRMGRLGRDETARGTYQLPPTRRGLFEVGPLTLRSTDPFGLVERTWTAGPTSTLVAYPVPETVPLPGLRAGVRGRANGAAPVTGHDNDEFASLRDYRPGDDLRRVHWPSSARSDTLMVREYHLDRAGHLAVVVDLRRSWSPAGFERGLSVAAGFVAAATGAGLPVRLLSTAGLDSGTGVGTGHRDRIFDQLAGLERTSGGERGARGARGGGGRRLETAGTVVLVAPDAAGAADLASTLGRHGADILTFVVDTDDDGRPGGRR